LALAHQLLGHFAVALEPLHLVVGPLVPGDAEPLHALEDRLARELGRPLEVRVLDAQDEGAVVAARIRPAEERSARTADVQIAGGTGSEAGADHDGRRRQTRILVKVRPAASSPRR